VATKVEATAVAARVVAAVLATEEEVKVAH